jgi:hypothetical protein
VPAIARSGEHKAGASLRIDLTGQGKLPVLVHLFFVDREEPVTDEEAQDLLAPFDLWRGR